MLPRARASTMQLAIVHVLLWSGALLHTPFSRAGSACRVERLCDARACRVHSSTTAAKPMGLVFEENDAKLGGSTYPR